MSYSTARGMKMAQGRSSGSLLVVLLILQGNTGRANGQQAGKDSSLTLQLVLSWASGEYDCQNVSMHAFEGGVHACLPVFCHSIVSWAY